MFALAKDRGAPAFPRRHRGAERAETTANSVHRPDG